MRRRLFFGGKPRPSRSTLAPLPAATDELPADVIAAIEAASILERHAAGDHGRPELRVLVQIGRGGWFHNDLETPAQLRRIWPSLSEAQIRRAVRFVDARVALSLREAAPVAERRNWATQW